MRFKMPDGEIAFDDLVRGRVSFHSDHVPDYALARANGDPLYTLVNPVDDALMEITHVLRGEDLLSSTPRQIPLYAALAEVGIGSGAPEFGHLPYVMGQGNKKLSKRDPEANALGYREAGFLPEGLLNYLALLGWAISGDRDIFTLDEMVTAFDIGDVNPNPARFDLKKADAINGSHMRLLSIEDMTHRVLPFLKDAGVVSDPVSDSDAQLLELAMPLVSERINKLDRGRRHARLPVRRRGVVHPSTPRTSKSCSTSRAAHRAGAYDDMPRAAHVVDRCDPGGAAGQAGRPARLKPRVAFGPVRVAITGRRVSPPLFESMELLGRDRSLSRLQVRAEVSGLEYHRIHRGGRWGANGWWRGLWSGFFGVPGRARAARPGRGAGGPGDCRLLRRRGSEHGPGRGEGSTRAIPSVSPQALSCSRSTWAGPWPSPWCGCCSGRLPHGLRPGWLSSDPCRGSAGAGSWSRLGLSFLVAALDVIVVSGLLLPSNRQTVTFFRAALNDFTTLGRATTC